MARLDKTEYKRWVEAFTDAFDNRDDLRRVVGFGTDYSLDYWVPDTDLRSQIEMLVRKVDDKGLLRPLLDAARRERTDNRRLEAISARLEISLQINPEEPFDAIRIFGDPMLDRNEFRNKLKLLKTETVPPVLLVDGGRYSGKSWGIRLVTYGARKSNGIKPAVVDLRDYKGRLVDAGTLGELIAEEIDYDKPSPKPSEEQDAQWIRQYCGWLRRELKGLGGDWWIVIDDLEKVTLAESAKDFIYALGKAIPTSMPMVRLIIVSYHDPEALATGVGAMDRDPVPRMTIDEIKEHLANFFAAVYLEREITAGRHLTREELEPRIAASTNAVLAEIVDTNEKRLEQMGEAVRKELART
jgi:Effector-associated domain 1